MGSVLGQGLDHLTMRLEVVGFNAMLGPIALGLGANRVDHAVYDRVREKLAFVATDSNVDLECVPALAAQPILPEEPAQSPSDVA